MFRPNPGPPLMVILILIPLLMAGVIVWRRRKTPLLFIGTVLMVAGSAIPIPIESSVATNVFEPPPLILVADGSQAGLLPNVVFSIVAFMMC